MTPEQIVASAFADEIEKIAGLPKRLRGLTEEAARRLGFGEDVVSRIRLHQYGRRGRPYRPDPDDVDHDIDLEFAGRKIMGRGVDKDLTAGGVPEYRRGADPKRTAKVLRQSHGLGHMGIMRTYGGAATEAARLGMKPDPAAMRRWQELRRRVMSGRRVVHPGER